MVGWYDGLAQGYGVDFASDEYDEFNVFNETSSEVEGLRETLKDVSGPVDFITALISGGYKVLLSFLTSIPKIGFGLLVSAQEATDMPAEVVNIGITMLLVVVIFAVLALIMKVRA